MNGSPARYVLDANVFIEAARRYYAFDIVLSFWQALVDQAKSDRVLSIDRVKAEIDRGADALKDWANNDFHEWFVPTDQADVIEAYRQIMAWVHSQAQFTNAAKATFSRAENADAWLVAYALAKGCMIVTHEQFDQDVRSRIPIPNVCQAFGVRYVDTFQMLRDLGAKIG
ncbi:MAG TPA: DUF4411 family protein [Thermodesulfobacteriota bacterium]|nr:DUF4411 family protein [Thermodesulfobacteriota bacterium]